MKNIAGTEDGNIFQKDVFSLPCAADTAADINFDDAIDQTDSRATGLRGHVHGRIARWLKQAPHHQRRHLIAFAKPHRCIGLVTEIACYQQRETTATIDRDSIAAADHFDVISSAALTTAIAQSRESSVGLHLYVLQCRAL